MTDYLYTAAWWTGEPAPRATRKAVEAHRKAAAARFDARYEALCGPVVIRQGKPRE